MMDTLNNPLIALSGLVMVIILAIASEPYGHTYSEKERADMAALIAKVTAPQTPQDKIVYLFGEE